MDTQEIIKKQEFLEAEVKNLRQLISAKDQKQKSGKIEDRMQNYSDICEELNIDPIKSLPYPEPKTIQEIFINANFKISNIAQVFNEDHVFKMDGFEKRWYPWFNLSSGFVFTYASYGSSFALTSSASRLCFKSEILAVCAGKRFIKEYEELINPKL